MLVVTHDDRQIEYVTVPAELGGPAGTGDMAESVRRTARGDQQGQRPRVAMEFVDDQIIARGANLAGAIDPGAQAGPIAQVVEVIEQPGTGQHFFAAGVVADL